MSDITNADVIKSWGGASREQAEQHGDEGDFARQFLLNPVLFRLAGEVAGKHILDAGCGQGYLCRLLAKKGAHVTGVEPAEGWFRYALEREQAEPSGIIYRQEDLSALQGLTNSFDCVISNMVFMDIPDYQSAIRNCIAALKPGGSFIFSITHPCFEEGASEWTKKGYVEVHEYSQEFAHTSSFGYWFHRPLSTYLNLVIRAGCTIQEMIEPRLNEEIVQRYGEQHARNVHVPQYVVVHASK
ncbi:MAG TPA: class I SAM-dependent methyltransferase [Ktedonosporobacter sp.]|nr:class I SAM-dependent methyltransferase [Ktedonosporobacter sp.]